MDDLRVAKAIGAGAPLGALVGWIVGRVAVSLRR
jgi:hypothetical protein